MADDNKRVVRITAPGGSFRRAGMSFGTEPVTIPATDLTGAQLILLTNEPELRVEATVDGEIFVGLPRMTEELAAAYNQEMARLAGSSSSSGTQSSDTAAAAAAVAARETSETAEEVAAEIGADSGDSTGQGASPETGDGPHASAADVSAAIDPAASAEQLAGTSPEHPPTPPKRSRGKA